MPSRAFLKNFIPVCFATVALGLSFLANIYCEAISFPSSESGVPTLHFGVWYSKGYETVVVQPGDRLVTRDTCDQYPSSVDIDVKWKTARAFSIMAPILGGIVVFWNWLAPCFYAGDSFWKASGMAFMVCCLFQGLTLLLLDSDACLNNVLVQSNQYEYASECELGMGAKSNIASVVCWFVAGALMLCVMPSPQRPERPPAETQTVTYTKTEQPDGTQVVTEEVVKGTYVEKPVGEEVPAKTEEAV